MICDSKIVKGIIGSHSYLPMSCLIKRVIEIWQLMVEMLKLFIVYVQGGKFDHADRLFQSVEGTYRNCLSNTSDVKELIPEFFYMPEFLVNSNSYHLGVKQDGEPIGDVCLPPWAKVCGFPLSTSGCNSAYSLIANIVHHF